MLCLIYVCFFSNLSNPPNLSIHIILRFPQELECAVSLEDDNRQEWTFTLYDFDNSGKVTREVRALVGTSASALHVNVLSFPELSLGRLLNPSTTREECPDLLS